MTTAFGLQGLGLPLHGLETNQNDAGFQINSDECIRFLNRNIGTNKCFITFSGYENHHKIFNMCNEYFDHLNPVSPFNDEQKISKYLGGVCKLHSKDMKKSCIKAFIGCELMNKKSILIELIPYLRINDNSIPDDLIQKLELFQKQFSQCSLFGAQLLEVDQSIEECEQYIDQYFNRLANRIPSNIFSFAKESYLNNTSLLLQSPSSRFLMLSKWFFLTKSFDYLSRLNYLKQCSDVELCELIAISKRNPPTSIAYF